MTNTERLRKSLYWATEGLDDDFIAEIAFDDYGLEDFEGFTEDEVSRWEAEADAIRQQQLEWLRTHSRNHRNYSDIYKDVYGVRPRW